MLRTDTSALHERDDGIRCRLDIVAVKYFACLAEWNGMCRWAERRPNAAQNRGGDAYLRL